MTLKGWIVLTTLLLLSLPGLNHAGEIRDPATFFFDQSMGNLQQEAAIARTEGKQGIIILFEQASCSECAKMATAVLSHASVQKFYHKNFRILQVDINADAPLIDFTGQKMAQKDFASKYRVHAAPVSMFFNLDGKLMLRYAGVARDPNEFIWLGEFVATGDYKDENFTVYKRERMAEK